MCDVKQVKVDNWGIFFLQRLKHFFNRTDYCDLTLQFQDNARLKVHRLVLSACTEYFELLERTCEMYEDCLVMPDDLQADVVVPIVNFMYTGQLEFRMDLLEKLYQTSLVMNMPVLTKLLDAHRNQNNPTPTLNYNSNPKKYSKSNDTSKQNTAASSSSTVPSSKRSYSSAFDSSNFRKYKKPSSKSDTDSNAGIAHVETPSIDYQQPVSKKQTVLADPRPTRYELPEELDTDNLFVNSFTNISYTSKPLMVHPETIKRYPSKRLGIFEDPSTSKHSQGNSTMDIVECKKISINDSIYDDESETINDDHDQYSQSIMSIKDEPRNSNQLFDQILESDGPKVTIETKDNKQANNLDHAKIISEVLKKYPHLVKSNKNIKLKILNTPNKKKTTTTNSYTIEKETKKSKQPDFTFETDVIDSKEAAKLIALGAENVKGPWICLICGTPGKAIHFTSYYKFRRHLVEVHHEKPVSNSCEYCGLKSLKRNYLLHHLYTKHGVEPPPQYRFPKCNLCNYVALTEGYLVKHNLSHSQIKSFRCNVCSSTFASSQALLGHIRKTGHKYSADRKLDLQCIYCLKVFLREANLYAHLKTLHKEMARSDGIIDISDDENQESYKIKENTRIKPSPNKQEVIKYEVPITFENEYEESDIQYQIQQQPDGNIEVISKKPRVLLPVKHKILNSGFSTSSAKEQTTLNSKTPRNIPNKQSEFVHDEMTIGDASDEIIMIDNREFIVKDNQLIPKKERVLRHDEYVCYEKPDIVTSEIDDSIQTIAQVPVEFTSMHPNTNQDEHKMIIKKAGNINQPIQIVVSNEEEYKALMASNHSIIFEDSDTNKTLTVLTTPHATLNSTSIDLETTQSNDMMIIPEGYPLNVSEATVSTDNSNIVVVYSHRVNDPNKPYQVITSQNLGEQYATTSGMLTQNYETVTTSASVMNTHVIEAPVVESWQNSIPQNITTAEITVPITEQTTVTPVDNQHSLNNLAEIQVATSEPVPMEINQVDVVPIEINQVDEQSVNQTTVLHSVPKQLANSLNQEETVIGSIQSDDIKSDEAVPDFGETIHSLNTTNTVIDPSENTVHAKDQTNDSNEDIIHEEMIPGSHNHDKVLIVNEAVAMPDSDSQQQNIDETEEIQEISNQEDIDSVENISKEIENSSLIESRDVVPNVMETNTPAVGESINNGKMSLTKLKNPIESLTSEWSEDELETVGQEPRDLSENALRDNNIENETTNTDSQPELEESIENIQQEMAKQIARSLEVSATKQKSVQKAETAVDIAACTGNKDTTEKITSLLNDWEDNDSQEEDVSNIEETTATIKQNETTQNQVLKSTVKEVGKTDRKADDNIKKLVSDWEDEEIEETENKVM